MSLKLRGNGTPIVTLAPPYIRQVPPQCTDLVREYRFIIEYGLGPIHQRINILGCRQLCWSLVLDSILP